MTDKTVPVIYGEVLYDCFPDGSRVLGGAPFNVAWHCQAFGLSPLFVSRVGDDQMGQQIKLAMQEWGMDTSGLQLDKQHPTGIVDVSIVNDQPSYNIVENSAWDFIEFDLLPEIAKDIILYHGSLALRSKISRETLSRLKQDKSASVFVDVNLRDPWWNKDLLDSIIADGRWLKLNDDELSILIPEQSTFDDRVDYLHSNASLDLLVVTQGKKGAIAVNADGKKESISPDHDIRIVDTVGAGDAFSSVILLGQYRQWPLHITLQRAQQFASAIVGVRGATIKDQAFYQKFIDIWFQVT